MMRPDSRLEFGSEISRPCIGCPPAHGHGQDNRAPRLRRALYSSAKLGTLSVLILLLAIWNATVAAQTLRSKEDVARIVSIEKLSVKDAMVSGEVQNKSPHTLRDVEILARYTWLWDDEFHPGSNDPSSTYIYKLPQEIPQNGTVPFTFSPAPALAKAPGGRFVTSVYIAGFTEVIPQKR